MPSAGGDAASRGRRRARFLDSLCRLYGFHPGAASAGQQRRADRGLLSPTGWGPGHTRRAYLVPFAGIAFLWFIAAIRSHLGEREDRFFATVFLGSGLLFVGMLFAASACAGAPLVSVKFLDQPPPDADTFLLARALGFSFLFIFAVRAAAVFMLVASTIGLRTGFLPRWLVLVGYVGGAVFLFSVTYIEGLVLIFPAWVIAVSVVMLRAGGDLWHFSRRS